MSSIHNYSGEPIQVLLLNGKVLDLPEEESPIQITSKTPIKKVISLPGQNEMIVKGNAVSIDGTKGFPPIRPDTYYIVTEEIANALRKIQRGASDLLIATKTKRGYYELAFANVITELNDDRSTNDFVRDTWQNALPQIEKIKYDSVVQVVSNR